MFDRLLRRSEREAPAAPWFIGSFSGLRLYPLPGGALLGITGERHNAAEVEATSQSAGITVPQGLDRRTLAIARAEHGQLRWFPVELIPAPDNPYDENAIEARSAWGLVGYIDRDHAADFRAVFDLLRRQGFDGAVVAGFCRPVQNQIVVCLSFSDICYRHLIDELVCKEAWGALLAGSDAAEVAVRFGYGNTGALRRSVRAYARNHGLPDPETGKL